MNRTSRLAPTFLIALALAGCEEPQTAPGEQGSEAAGEVLGGTISDAMIPLEQLESQSPPLVRRPAAADIDNEQPELAGEPDPESQAAEASDAAPAAEADPEG